MSPAVTFRRPVLLDEDHSGGFEGGADVTNRSPSPSSYRLSLRFPDIFDPQSAVAVLCLTTWIRWPAVALMMAVAATLSTSATAEKISASEAIEKIESRDEPTISFVFGIYTGIYRANESLIAKHQPSLYCPPTIFVADGPNVIDILESFVNRFPASKQQPVGVVMLDALVSVFPCPG
jgi:hypothetical protein